MMRAYANHSIYLPLIVLLYLLLCAFTFNYVEEDAYIYFHFAANIAEGYGYVFNRGDLPVEAGTGLVWQLLLLPLYWLSPDLLISTKLLGVGFGVMCLLLTYRVSAQLIEDPILNSIPSLWLAVSIPFYTWSHYGLETPQFLFCLLLFFYCLIYQPWQRFWPVAAFLVVFSRPEGFMMLALLAVATHRTNIFTGPRHRIALLALAVTAALLFRLVYFADLVPHSFYHKIQSNPSRALTTLWQFFEYSLLFIPVLVILLAGCIRPRQLDRDTVLLLAALLITLVWGAMGKDQKPHYRSFFAMLPFLYILTIRTVSRCNTGANTLWPKLVCAAALVFSLCLLSLSQSNVGGDKFDNPLRRMHELDAMRSAAGGADTAERVPVALQGLHNLILRESGQIYDNYQRVTGEVLALNYPGEITVVYDQMGQTPWFAGLEKNFIDAAGLTDRPIGFALFNEKAQNSHFLGVYQWLTLPLIKPFDPLERTGWNTERALDYVFEQKPELIILHALNKDGRLQKLLREDARFQARYSTRYTINWAAVYERNDFTDRERELVFPDNCYCSLVEPKLEHTDLTPTSTDPH